MKKLIFKCLVKALKKHGYIVISEQKLTELGAGAAEPKPSSALAAAVLEARKAKVESYLLLQQLENVETRRPVSVG